MSAIACTFVDLRTVKTRKMVQLILEAPVEQAEAVIDLLGFPRADNPVHVAIARLMEAPKGGDAADPAQLQHDAPPPSQVEVGAKHRTPWHKLSRAQQAGIRANDEAFRRWLFIDYEVMKWDAEVAAMEIREHCGVGSRSELDNNSAAGERWDKLDAEYRQSAGLDPEVRG